ncbi:putative Superoxide reductase [Nitrospina watsonii]|uniref:Superoxide reductase n=2 Tax=Nitrospina watsonii TaxID=1323948 RepID=A0ABM9HB00_9BACT|nr:putative Superoxide reductase [Nitrospina watsonii]
MNSDSLTRRGFVRNSVLTGFSFFVAMLGSRLFYAQPAYSEDKSWFTQINRAKDSSNLQGHEKGHVPIIFAPGEVKAGEPFNVEVQVGQNMHEMIPEHYIDWVDLYAGDIFLTKIVLTPNFTQAKFKVTLTLTASTTLRAIEHCNLHGLWEGTKSIRVDA